MKMGRYGVAVALAVVLAGALSFSSCAPTPPALPGSPNAPPESETVEKPATEPFFPVKQNGKWGYIDRAGTIIIKPQFDHADDFQDGLARINVGGDWLLGDYVDGGKWGYIDRSGQPVIKPRFDQAEPFYEGMAWVCIGDDETGKVGFINNTGEFAFMQDENLQLDRHDSFSEGLLPVNVAGDGAYVDPAGKTVIRNPRFLCTYSFSEGVALVSTGHLEPRGTDGFIDKEGRFVVEPQLSNASSFSEGLAAARDKPNNEGGKYGYIDKSGKWVIEPQFEEADPFSEGLAFVVWSRFNRGYIDKTGKVVLRLLVDYGMGFSEGLAAVELNEKCGFIDRTGHPVVKLRYDTVQDFSHGLAQVTLGNKIGYIDKTGKYVWELTE